MGRRIIVWPTPRTIEREWNMFHVYFIGGRSTEQKDFPSQSGCQQFAESVSRNPLRCDSLQLWRKISKGWPCCGEDILYLMGYRSWQLSSRPYPHLQHVALGTNISQQVRQVKTSVGHLLPFKRYRLSPPKGSISIFYLYWLPPFL